MRRALISLTLVLGACALAFGKGAPPPPAAKARPTYRIGKAPKPEFKVGEKTYKINPEHKSVKAVRALPPEHFDPLTRRERVEKFYREMMKERYAEFVRLPRHYYGPFRAEFVYWVRHHWRAELWARWAWHHHIYIDDLIWAEWMNDRAFAKEIANLKRQNVAADVGYLPAEYASTSPAVIYNDEYVDAVFNPLPYLAVLSLKSLNPDPKTDWIGAATADSLLSKLASVPGLYVADRQQVSGALKEQKVSNADDPQRAAQVGKAIDVERVVAGSYVVDGDKVLFNLRIVDVQSGAVQNGVSKTIPREKLLDEMPGLALTLAGALGYSTEDDAHATTVSTVAAGSVPTPAHQSVTGSTVTPSRPGNIFEPGPAASPGQSLPAVPALPGTGKAVRHTFTSADKITGDIAFTAADGPYEIQGKLEPEEGTKDYRLTAGPGAEVRNGTIVLLRGGRLTITGTPENPVIFRHVYFQQNWDAHPVSARYAIFEDCKFRKGGNWYNRAGLSSKWEFDKCLIVGSAFPKITHVDYGIKLTDCTFSGVTFEDIAHPSPKDKPMDWMEVLRKDWRRIDHCRFDGCTVPPVIFWCATASNYTHCTFSTGTAFESDTPTDVVAYVEGTSGDAPDKANAANPAKRAALKVSYVPQPFTVFAFPK